MAAQSDGQSSCYRCCRFCCYLNNVYLAAMCLGTLNVRHVPNFSPVLPFQQHCVPCSGAVVDAFLSLPLAIPADKRGPNEGSIVKELNISPALIGDEGDYMFDICERVQASGVEKRVSVSVSRAEFFAIRRIAEFAIPYLLGMDLSLTTYLPYSHMGPQGYNQPPMGGQPGPY